MVRVAGYEYDLDAAVQVNLSDANIVMDVYRELKDDELLALKSAALLETYTTIDEEEKRVGSYALVAWKSFEKTGRGYQIVWQTYRTEDIESIKDAILELAAIVGGGNG